MMRAKRKIPITRSRPSSLYQLVAFTLLLGAAQGVITIVRGAVPLALFGAEGYGAVLGAIATPVLLVNAFSPAIFALLVDHSGWHSSVNVLFGCGIATWVAIEVMSRWYEGARARTNSRLATEP
jgi:MFS family permease